MPRAEFEKKYRFRICEKCCATCKHIWSRRGDDVRKCVHPEHKGEQMEVFESDVCDAWEGSK